MGATLLTLFLLSLVPSAFAWAGAPWHRVKPRAAEPWPESNPWIKRWTKRDHDLEAATTIAAATFHVSKQWLLNCKDDEGGDTGREVLRWSLRVGPHGRGWNLSGSRAFGPWQFMLGDKPAPRQFDRHGVPQWGTFGRYVHSAFAEARRRGVIVPFRFKTPDSYVGQALTAGFMFSTGQSHQWTGAGC